MCCFVVICVIGGRAMGILCAWCLCAAYVKTNSNVQTKPIEYDYFDILVGGGGDLHFDPVSFLDYFVYRAENALMIVFVSLWKAIHDTADCGLLFLE